MLLQARAKGQADHEQANKIGEVRVMETLTCIRDQCPKCDRFVDYRRCCYCDHYNGQPICGTVQCEHPDAGQAKGNGYTGEIRHIFPALVRQTY